jgi:hypothetical protein
MAIDISGLARVPNTYESGGVKSAADNDNGPKFMADMLAVAQSQAKNDTPQVYAGQSKEFDFWLKDEKIAHKTEKLRTVDDALAEIGRIIDALKKES